MEKLSVNNNLIEGNLSVAGLEKGCTRTIDAEIRCEEINNLGISRVNTEEYRLKPLRKAKEDGYSYILRLPRVNESGCLERYGSLYDKTDDYKEFIRTLAQRIGVLNLKGIYDDCWVFTNKEDAEHLGSKLIEHQKKAAFEFDVISD